MHNIGLCLALCGPPASNILCLHGWLTCGGHFQYYSLINKFVPILVAHLFL